MTSEKSKTTSFLSKMLHFKYLFPVFILAAVIYSVHSSLADGHGPPPVDQVAKMARYIVHHSEWMSLAYQSKHNRTLDYPMARVYSVSDGLANSSTGIPYIMASPLDETIHDLMIPGNERASVIMSLSQSHYCYEQNYDPEDPRCAQVILTGKFVVLNNETAEYTRAKKFLWTKHPVMQNWTIEEPSHDWKFAKLQIHHVCVLDTFGGRKFPTVADYFRSDPDRLTLHSFLHQSHHHHDPRNVYQS
ncbi:protein CREG1 isoform X2 [Diaphorina citri]|uniref:Protein CREG1 isoform X1 n=2 Tax=Diaphorina citri TaxID=121845 RepID=A0A1S3CTG6_DIACI|nr:protein CREG1 isoform X1 [Diaphorina citri]XP_008467464.1 protein CREG1 isoform X2 [Diaphorina citri]